MLWHHHHQPREKKEREREKKTHKQPVHVCRLLYRLLSRRMVVQAAAFLSRLVFLASQETAKLQTVSVTTIFLSIKSIDLMSLYY